ncbi:hypothetical protein [Salinihabitans flavidus]|uniref:hypothetical protein n=1 Tax=Salinihabitans flavidus TaxID=569882 RepID=UPI0011139C59|nr:hypothetical protein [Salinihabitans flavidus]
MTTLFPNGGAGIITVHHGLAKTDGDPQNAVRLDYLPRRENLRHRPTKRVSLRFWYLAASALRRGIAPEALPSGQEVLHLLTMSLK